MNIPRFLNKGISIIMALFVLWVSLSYIEVITKNTKKDPIYNKNNFIVMMVNIIDGL